jgi:hypothetical protein
VRVSLRDVGELVRELVDYQRAAFGTLQVVRGEGVGGGITFPEPSDRTFRGVRSPLAGCPV